MRKHLHKLKAHAHLVHTQKEWIIAVALVILALVLLAASTDSQRPFVSSEVQFTDPSVRGLAIVPASCPSTPHDSEVCDVPVSSGCSLSATSGTIAPGQSTTLQWDVSQPALGALFPASFSGNISPAVGSISSWTGSMLVSPQVTTTYVLNGTVGVVIPWFGGLRTGSVQCQTTVSVQALLCPTGSYAYNGACVSGCPSGYYKYNGSCVQPCPTGYVVEEGACVFSACPAGYYKYNGSCVQPCPTGYVVQEGSCVFSACPEGYTQQGSVCISTDSCTPLNYCVGTTLWHRNASCSTNPIQACSNGCTAGGCIGVAAPGVVVWQVRPPLLNAGETANVSWQVTDVRSCEVQGNNGDAWSGTSGAQISSPITAQTIYTLSCIGLDDSTVTRTATVNINPIFQEL